MIQVMILIRFDSHAYIVGRPTNQTMTTKLGLTHRTDKSREKRNSALGVARNLDVFKLSRVVSTFADQQRYDPTLAIVSARDTDCRY